MENQSLYTQDTNLTDNTPQKKELGLPLVAFGLSFVPALLVFFGSLGLELPGFAFLFIILLPVAGLITGIGSLSRGKERIGIAGKIFAIIAIALPASAVAFIFVFFFGAALGIVSLM